MFMVIPCALRVASFTACEMDPQIKNNDTEKAQEISWLDSGSALIMQLFYYSAFIETWLRETFFYLRTTW